MGNTYQIPPNRSCTLLERKRFWEKVIADQEISSMTAVTFCQQHQISIATFKQWKYRLQKEGEQFDGSNSKESNQIRNQTIGFIPLQISANSFLTTEGDKNGKKKECPERETELKIVFKNGHSIIISLAISAEVLSSLIYQVAKLPC